MLTWSTRRQSWRAISTPRSCLEAQNHRSCRAITPLRTLKIKERILEAGHNLCNAVEHMKS